MMGVLRNQIADETGHIGLEALDSSISRQRRSQYFAERLVRP
jgi:hypothetical protein